MTKAEQQKLWADRIAAFKSSGQKISVWCAANNLKPRQFSYWLKKDSHKATPSTLPPTWLKLEVRHQEERPQDHALLIRMGQATVEVKPGFDQKLLLSVLSTLRVLC